MALRRAVAKNKSVQQRAKRLICHYNRSKDEKLSEGAMHQPNGPIAHLLKSFEQMGAIMNGDFVVQMDNECDVNILFCPVQHIKPIFSNAKGIDRTTRQTNTRCETINLKEIDKQITNAHKEKLSPQDASMCE